MTDFSDFKAKDAASYDDVADTFDRLAHRYAMPQAQFLVQSIDIETRKHVIDMGCGTGLVAFEAAKASGPQTSITGIDLSRGMLAKANSRAASIGLADRVRFEAGDAEALNLPNQCAGGFVSLYAFSHFPHPERAAKEAFRILAPGGRFAVAIGSAPRIWSLNGMKRAKVAFRGKWDRAWGREVTACDQIDRLVRKYLPAVSEGKVADWASGKRDLAGLLDGLFREAGFQNRRRDWVGTDYSIVDIQTFWELQSTISTFARKHIAAASAAQIHVLKEAFWEECAAVLKASGRLRYSVGAAVICACKPV